MNDLNLLRLYAQSQCEDSFAELVKRHVDFVYSVALRQVRSPHLAEEITQSVFMLMARNASTMKPGTILAAWLYQVTRRTAINVARTESRRRLREQTAQDIAVLRSDSADWASVEPLLDEAMDKLDQADRSAILLRFFQNKSLRDVGRMLGISEEAARKRVSRAVDQLRDGMTARGVAVTSAGLVVILDANALQFAPIGLGATICNNALVAGVHTSKTIAIAKSIVMTTTQKIALTATVAALAVGAVVRENYRVSGLRSQLQALQMQHEPMAASLLEIQRQRDDTSNQLQLAQTQLQQLRRDAAELPKLRGQIARWRDAAEKLSRTQAAEGGTENDPTDSVVKSWANQVKQLKQRTDQWPDKKIPELQLVNDQDWFDAVGQTNSLASDADFRQALDRLRRAAKNKLVPLLQQALKNYAASNGGQLPSDLSQLQPFLDPSVDSAMLQRYQMVQGGNLSDLPPHQPILMETAAVDDQYDERYIIMMDGAGASGW